MPAHKLAAWRRNCPHCKSGAEVFRYLKRRYIFDVDLARQLVNDGREPQEVARKSVRWCVDTTHIYRQHVRHVNTKYPGIIAHVFFPLPDGTDAHGHLLIDGNHRAARCLKEGKPFFAYILSERESRRILLKSPRRPRRSNVLKATGSTRRRPNRKTVKRRRTRR